MLYYTIATVSYLILHYYCITTSTAAVQPNRRWISRLGRSDADSGQAASVRLDQRHQRRQRLRLRSGGQSAQSDSGGETVA